jgi:hypothetical protein
MSKDVKIGDWDEMRRICSDRVERKRKRIQKASCKFVEGRKEGREPCQGGKAGMQQEEE